MKIIHFVSILCIAVISYTAAHISFIKLSHEINKLEIIENFCINKEETTFKCDGECHLKTQFENVADSNPIGNSQLIEENRLTLFSVIFKIIEFNQNPLKKQYLSDYLNGYSFIHSKRIFQPPKFG